ncbi:MAG: hypothetical protein H6741_23075 [Alphaproteobacteria bacterium]|nr:hypothetical protein [Alphaproteobacteria bacterium]
MDLSFLDAYALLHTRMSAEPSAPAVPGPEPLVEWSLPIELAGPSALGRVQSHATPAWLMEQGRPSLFGRGPDGALGYVYSADPPDPVRALELAWRIRPLDPREQLDGAALMGAAEALAQALGARLGAPSLPLPQLAARRRELDALHRRCALTVELALMAPEGGEFSGPSVLAALQDLRLVHGDMDMFHVLDPEDESLLGVAPIGEHPWFEPSALAADLQRPQGLLLSFSVPRTREPMRVTELIGLLAIELRGRLGGQVHDLRTGMAAEGITLRRRVKACVRELEAAGFPPGGRAAQMLF